MIDHYDFKVGDPVEWHDLGQYFIGTVFAVRDSNKYQAFDVTEPDGTEWSFNTLTLEFPLRHRNVKFSDPEPISDFEDQVRTTLEKIGDLLIEKNKAYGNSALDPVRIFSKSDATEQLRVRIDDKLSRCARGSEYPGDDTVTDLLGYLVLLKIALNDAEAR